MSLRKYFYNPATLRYEPIRVSWLRIVFTSLGLLSFGLLFFVGLMWLQNYFLQTPKEIALREENAALSNYKVQLTSDLSGAKQQLSELERSDKTLYEKIFEGNKSDMSPQAGINKEILLADVPAFRSAMTELLDKSSELVSTARLRNYYFGEAASVKKTDLSMLMSIPSFPPIDDLDETKLVSGYGMRINPFHKGMYHHDGIDLAAARGSEVLAAAKGTIIAVNFSDLQAGFGNYVVIDHGNGYVTHYANLGGILVQYGQRITKGQPIGTIGMSGGSVAPHVHFEVIQNGKNVDPIRFLMHGLTADQFERIWIVSRKQNQSLD